MSRHYRDYGGSSSRYASAGRSFSIPDADFQRGDSTLKRRRQLSPPRAVAPSRRAAQSSDGTVAMRARSKSKSRARAPARKTPGQEFIALGSNRAGGASTLNTNKANYYHPPVAEPYRPPPAAARARSRSPNARQSRWDAAPRAATSGRRNLSPISMRTRSKSVTREKEDTAAAIRRSQRERSKSAARRSGGAPLSSRKESSRTSRTTESSSTRSSKKRERSASKPRERERDRGRERERERSISRDRRSRRSRAEDEEKPTKSASRSSRRSSTNDTSLQEIENAITDSERELAPKQKELEALREEMDALKQRVKAKELEVFDIQVTVDALQKRRKARLPSNRSSEEETPSRREETSTRRSRSKSKSRRRESQRSSSHQRASKRPCIVDEDDEASDDDEVIIMDPNEVKKELESSAAASKSTVVPVEDTMPDNFWGRSPTPKLLANHRFHAIPDGSVRKGRHLAFNPIQPQIFATSPDEGGLILWSYQRQDQQIAKVVTLNPSSFRKDSPCAEAISWSPDGNRMAMAFRDPLHEKGEFCIVQLHQLKLEDSDTPQPIPRDRITSKSTTLHSRGISAIDWLPAGFGPETTSHQLITTGNSDHAVVLWEEQEGRQGGGLDLKWSVLHRVHRSEVRSLCVHSKRDCLYTGGLDGMLIRYDFNKSQTQIVMERRKPISKINAVLEHPHNPNLLLVSSIEQATHNLLLHDLRQRYDPNGMSLTWDSGSMSQYIVPRWSPAGYHVSCGSKTGVVNIWDVRMRGEHYPAVRPQQCLRVHHKTVLHATWHPRYDAMFSVSHDRTLGLLTFR